MTETFENVTRSGQVKKRVRSKNVLKSSCHPGSNEKFKITSLRLA